MPRRLKVRGVRPGCTTDELGQKRPDPSKPGDTQVHQPATKWAASDPSILTDNQRRFILSKVFKVAVKTVFTHHMYQFNGETYYQASGAPIGLRLTSIVARVVMDEWAVSFLKRVSDAGVEMHALMKYVDDINIVMTSILHWGQSGLALEWNGTRSGRWRTSPTGRAGSWSPWWQ